jgi:hypothetical protein
MFSRAATVLKARLMNIAEKIRAIQATARPTITPAMAEAENVTALNTAPVMMMNAAAKAPIMPATTA